MGMVDSNVKCAHATVKQAERSAQVRKGAGEPCLDE